MAWYRAGSVTVANGSASVIGAGTDFVSNASAGEVFAGPDGRGYEVAQVVSATQLVLATTYQGASAGGQAYAIQPTSSFARDLAVRAAELLNTFAAVRDGIGQGLISSGGSSTSPALRFAFDPDTGIFSPATDTLGFAVGGHWSTWIDKTRIAIRSEVTTQNGPEERAYCSLHFLSSPGHLVSGIDAFQSPNAFPDAGGLRFFTRVGAATNLMRFDSSGNLQVGSGVIGNYNSIRKDSAGALVIAFGPSSGNSHRFYAASLGGASAVATCYSVDRMGDTGRSINAAGTINASGADYAEYMVKADGCGVIAPGDVCGVDRDGRLTKTWSAAISFVVKSTDPAYVGGDIWSAHLGPRPEAPDAEPTAPEVPIFPEPLGPLPSQPERAEGENDASFLDRVAEWMAAADAYSQRLADHQAYSVAADAYPALLAAHEAAHADWVADTARYEAAVAAWEDDLEAARVCVDRIAFAGQVPVNIEGEFEVGDYLIATANGGGIKAIAVPEGDITFDQYRRRLGKVWAIRDGRPWVDVQHG